jgi:membrane-bound ClpP family serine protease
MQQEFNYHFMRKIFIILAIILILFGIVFTILPMEKFGLLASLVAMIFSVLAYKKSKAEEVNFPKYLSIIAVATLFTATYFVFFTNNEVVAIDQQFEQQKIESEKEAKNTLESEGL